MVEVALDETGAPRVVTPGPLFWRVVRQIEAGFVVMCLLVSAAGAGVIPSSYDAKFREATAMYLPMWDWRWGKAQCYQESLLDPDAVSPVGAVGLCQFMPGTARDVWPRIGYGVIDPRQAEPSILAWGYYMAQLRRTWSAPRPEDDRRRLAQASYNAGAGNILKAQRSCNGAPDWRTIAACLPRITGRHSKETITYVERIAVWYRMLL